MTDQIENLKKDPEFLALPQKRQAQILMGLDSSAGSPRLGFSMPPGETPEEHAVVQDMRGRAKASHTITSTGGRFDPEEGLPFLATSAVGLGTGGMGFLPELALLGSTAYATSAGAQKYVHPDRPLADISEEAGRKGTEAMAGAIPGRFLTGIASRVARAMGFHGPVPVNNPVEQAASDVGIPRSSEEFGLPLRRPSTDKIASMYARSQEPRVLSNAAKEVNKELVPAGIRPIPETPVSQKELLQDVALHRTEAARDIVGGQKEAILQRQEAENIAKAGAANEESIAKAAQKNRAGQGQIASDIADAKAQEAFQQQLKDAEARVRGVVGDRAAAPAGEVGQQLKRGVAEGKEAAATAIGNRFDQIFAPHEGNPVDVSDLVSRVRELAKNQGDTPAVREAQAFLENNLVRLPESGASNQNLMSLSKLHQFSQKFGGKIKFDPTRGEAAAVPLRQQAESLIENALPGQVDEAGNLLGGPRMDYLNAKAEYAGKFAPDFKNRGGIIPSMLNPAQDQNPAGALDALFNGKAATNPSITRTVLRSLEAGREGATAKEMLRPALIDHLMEGGIEGFGKRLSKFSPEVLKMHLGAADAEALQTIAERLKMLGSKPTLPSSQMSAVTPYNLPNLVEPAPVRQSVTRDVQTVGKVAHELTSDRLRDIITALRSREQPLSSAHQIDSLEAVKQVFTSVPSLLKTVAAYHPQGGIAKFNRALGALISRTPQPMTQLLTGLADQMTRKEEGK